MNFHKLHHYLLFIGLFFLVSPISAQNEGEARVLSEPICIFIPIEEDQNLFIPAPPVGESVNGFPSVISPTAQFIVNYPGGIAQEVEDAFQYAVDIWSYQIVSNVPIEIDFEFSDLPGSTLGSAGPTSIRRDFTGALEANVWYPIALANKLAGMDLDDTQAEITISFDSESSWYFGTDGATPSGQFDFVSVVLHELGHGLGFVGSGQSDGTNGTWGAGTPENPYSYDNIVTNSSDERPTDFTTPSTDFHDYVTSNDLFIDGVNTRTANGDADAKLYAPSTFDGGSSYSHWDESTFNGTTNALMTPQIGFAEAIHDVGDITRGLFDDIGWTVKPNDDFAPFNLQASAITDTRIDLTWADNSDTETGFKIMRSETEGSGFTDLATIPADVLIYNDMTPVAGTTYYYKVLATASGGTESDPTETVEVAACASQIPTEGTWTGNVFSSSFGSFSNASITVSALGGNEFLFSDISGGLYNGVNPAFSANQSFTVIDDCDDLNVGTSVDAEFAMGTDESEGFGPGSYDEGTETIVLPWYDSNSGFGGTTTFTRNGDATLGTPTIPTGQIVFSNIGSTRMDVSFTAGNGTDRLVILRESLPPSLTDLPVDGSSYTANSDLTGIVPSLGDSKIVYNGLGTTFNLFGLTQGSSYYLSVFEYNNSTSEYLYNTNNPPVNAEETNNLISWDGSESTSWSDAGNWSTGAVPTSTNDVVIVDVGNDPVISNDQAVNDIEIESGATVTVESGASLAIFGVAFGDGDAIIERNTAPSLGYSIIGSPITDATISSVGADVIYDYDGSSYTVPTGTISPGKGYFAAFNDVSPTVSFTGTPNSGTVTEPVSLGGDNFNILSNPYSASISRSAFIDANGTGVIDGNIWLWDDGGSNSGGDRVGDYIAVNNLGATSTVDLGGGLTGSTAFNGNIGSVQGFLVLATDDADVTFTSDMQSTGAGDNSDANHYREDEYQTIRLSFSGNDRYSDIIIGMTERATLGKDYALDAQKFIINDELSLYSIQDEYQYAIQAIPLVEEFSKVSLGTSVGEADTYTFELEEVNNIDDLYIYLEDQLTGERFNLTNLTSVSILLEEGSTEDRFSITISNSILSVEELRANTLSVFRNNGESMIRYDSDAEEMVSLYSLSGKVLFNEKVTFRNGEAVLDVELEEKKIYLVRVNGESLKFILND